MEINKWFLLGIALIFLVILPIVSASSTLTQTTSSGKFEYDGVTVEGYITNQTKDISQVYYDDVKKEFYPLTDTKGGLTEYHWFVNKLETNKRCAKVSNLIDVCQYERLDFSKFESKNQIDKKEISLQYDKDNNFLGYLISYYGLIIDLDPSFVDTFTATASGYFNQTVATANGITLSGSNTTGNYSSPVFFNLTRQLLNVTLWHNLTSLNLYTRNATSYNLTDPNLVSQWSFNTNESGNATDDKGLNNGTCTGTACATWNNSYGFVGAGYNFDGNDYININSVVNDLSSTTTGTWTAWIYSDDYTSGNGVIIGFGDTNADQRMWIQTTATGKIVVFVRPMNTNWRLDIDNALTNGVWHMITIVQDGTSPIIYIDGSAVAQTFVTSVDKTTWFSGLPNLDNGRIGDFNYNSLGETGFFNGSVDDVRIYNRSLSASEVYNMYWNNNILWSSYTNEGAVTSGTPITGSGNGTFFQFLPDLNSAGFIFNYSVSPTSQSSPAPSNKPITPVIFVYPNLNLSVPYVKLGQNLVFN